MIKYIGKKHLDSGFYKQITLKQENNFVKVRVVIDERLKNAEVLKVDTKCITSQIEDLDEYHKIEEIVSYFLRNNTICEIAEKDDRVVITSTSSRKLVLKLGKECTSLLTMIIAKYNKDRLQFIDECKLKEIYIRTVHFNNQYKIIHGISNYFEGHNKYDENKNALLVLTLASTKENIASFDKVFIIEYIKELLHSASKRIISFDRNDMNGLELWVGDRKIKIPEELKKDVHLLIMNRNVEIDKMNDRQYKLEGIKWKN